MTGIQFTRTGSRPSTMAWAGGFLKPLSLERRMSSTSAEPPIKALKLTSARHGRARSHPSGSVGRDPARGYPAVLMHRGSRPKIVCGHTLLPRRRSVGACLGAVHQLVLDQRAAQLDHVLIQFGAPGGQRVQAVGDGAVHVLWVRLTAAAC